jgi:hypothetical protein
MSGFAILALIGVGFVALGALAAAFGADSRARSTNEHDRASALA